MKTKLAGRGLVDMAAGAAPCSALAAASAATPAADLAPPPGITPTVVGSGAQPQPGLKLSPAMMTLAQSALSEVGTPTLASHFMVRDSLAGRLQPTAPALAPTPAAPALNLHAPAVASEPAHMQALRTAIKRAAAHSAAMAYQAAMEAGMAYAGMAHTGGAAADSAVAAAAVVATTTQPVVAPQLAPPPKQSLFTTGGAIVSSAMPTAPEKPATGPARKKRDKAKQFRWKSLSTNVPYLRAQAPAMR